MKIRTIRYIIKEGLLNTYRNKLMSLASVVIVLGTLVVFGLFLLLVYFFEYNISDWKEQPQLEVFCYPVLDDAQVKMVEREIADNDMIASYEIMTREQALQKMEERLGKDAAVLEGYDESIFPVSFIIHLRDTVYSRDVIESLEDVSGVEKISYSQDVIDLISKISYWIKFISSLVTAIFLVVSMFIIANTIKLTVFARRREINIMKYIGATDWFIRWPFVVEGVIIGIIGSMLAFAITIYGYGWMETRLANEAVLFGTDLLKMMKIEDIWAQIATIFLAIGITVGAAGSMISIRKHLQV